MTNLRARLLAKPKDEVFYLPILSIALDRGGQCWKYPKFDVIPKSGGGLIIRVGWRWTAVIISVGGLMRLEKSKKEVES
jgi:hypothetical protein